MIKVKDSPDLERKYFSFLRMRNLLEEEIDAWLKHAGQDHGGILGRNFSQMERLRVFIDEMLNLAKPFLDTLSLDNSKDDFFLNTEEAGSRLRLAEFLWSYFRGKLEARLTPQFKDSLWAADLIAYDCYGAAMLKAEELAIPQIKKDEDGSPLRIRAESPLPYLESGMQGVVTLRRFDPKPFAGVMFTDGNERNRMLPIAVIEIPAVLVQNIWELVVLAHEVSHDIEGDLNTLHDDLPAAVGSAFDEVDAERGKNWRGWALEIFADLMALRLMGPAYAHYCFQLLLKRNVAADGSLQYPSNYLRMLLILHYLRKDLNCATEADAMEKDWCFIFDKLPETQAKYVGDFERVTRSLMDTPFSALQDGHRQNHRPAELVSFTSDDKQYIETTRRVLLAVEKLLPSSKREDDECRKWILEAFNSFSVGEIRFEDGRSRDVPIKEKQQPPAPRHVASAAYLAFAELLKTPNKKDLPRRLHVLNLAGQELVKAKQPAIQLAGEEPSTEQRKHVNNQAGRLFELVAHRLEGR